MQNRQDNDEEMEVPPKMVTALKQLPKEPVFVPTTLDEALMKAARQHLVGPERKRSRWFGFLPWTVATAGFAAAVLLTYPHAKEFGQSTRAVRRGSETPGESETKSQIRGIAFKREDVNRDGEVNILDAFMLAKKLQGTPFSEPALDVNRDGVIDRRDVDAIAAHAVSLEKRGRS